jgi:hypothetical protein
VRPNQSKKDWRHGSTKPNTTNQFKIPLIKKKKKKNNFKSESLLELIIRTTVTRVRRQKVREHTG